MPRLVFLTMLFQLIQQGLCSPSALCRGSGSGLGLDRWAAFRLRLPLFLPPPWGGAEVTSPSGAGGARGAPPAPRPATACRLPHALNEGRSPPLSLRPRKPSGVWLLCLPCSPQKDNTWVINFSTPSWNVGGIASLSIRASPVCRGRSQPPRHGRNTLQCHFSVNEVTEWV